MTTPAQSRSWLYPVGNAAEAPIWVEALEKTFDSRAGSVHAVAGVSFSVERGNVLGLLGPNGAGKTTTMRMLTTLLPIDDGRAIVAGVDVGAQPDRVRPHIGYVSQAGGADPLATGRENLALQGALYGMTREQLARRLPEVLALLDLDGLADRRVKTYSGGQRRRLDVALGVVHDPQVLFLDEPSNGLDPQNRANLWDHVRDLAKRGTTVVLTTHYLEEADALCDQVVIIDHGSVVAEGSPASLKAGIAGSSVALVLQDPADGPRAAQVLANLSGATRVTADGHTLRFQATEGARALPELLRALDRAGITVSSLNFAEASLDDVFMAATGRSLRDTTTTAPGRGHR